MKKEVRWWGWLLAWFVFLFFFYGTTIVTSILVPLDNWDPF